VRPGSIALSASRRTKGACPSRNQKRGSSGVSRQPQEVCGQRGLCGAGSYRFLVLGLAQEKVQSGCRSKSLCNLSRVMTEQESTARYWVWGHDRIAYGPVELPGLIAWIKEGCVESGHWVFAEADAKWIKAGEIPELKMFLEMQPAQADTTSIVSHAALRPENLRRIRLFAEMAPAQLESLVKYMEVVRVKKFATVFSKGDKGDAMYFVLEGEVRARTLIEGKETTLFTMGPGDSFGEIALLIHGDRSSDVLANEDSVLLRLPSAAFERIVREAPALATPFLLALARVITSRSLSLGREYEKSIRSARVLAQLRF